jgi:hypothetical protein
MPMIDNLVKKFHRDRGAMIAVRTAVEAFCEPHVYTCVWMSQVVSIDSALPI